MLHHVGIEVRPEDAARTVELFEVLGFELVEPPPTLADGFTWLERNGTQIHLIHDGNPVAAPRGHLALVAPDFDGAEARLRERGFEVERRREHWGQSRAVVVAPGGHRVEFMAAPPPGG